MLSHELVLRFFERLNVNDKSSVAAVYDLTKIMVDETV